MKIFAENDNILTAGVPGPRKGSSASADQKETPEPGNNGRGFFLTPSKKMRLGLLRIKK